MLRKSIKMQVSYLLSSKITIVTWFILMALVTGNFIENVMQNRNIEYITQMFDPVKILTLSEWSANGFILMSFYPLLIVMSTACVYIADKNSGADLYIKGKVGSKAYFKGQLIAVFIVTFLLFTLPFLLELALNSICFSQISIGDPSNFSYISTIEQTNSYFLYQVFLKNRIVYAVVCTLLFGLVAAVFAVLNYSLTTLRVFKYKVYAFFPIYILFFIVEFVDNFLNLPYSVNYFSILRMFDTGRKNIFAYTIFLIVLLIISNILVEFKIRRDEQL